MLARGNRVSLVVRRDNTSALAILDVVVSLAIAFGIAISIVAIWAWLGDWSQSRARKSDDEYWTSVRLACPNCASSYGLTYIQSRWTTFSEAPENGATIRCPECFEIAEFGRTTGTPNFISYALQPRLCCQCAERYNGTLESSCPNCASNESKVAAEVNFVTTVKDPTNNPMNPSGGSGVS